MMLTYYQLDFWKKLQWNFNQTAKFFFKWNYLKRPSAKWWTFCSGLIVLNPKWLSGFNSSWSSDAIRRNISALKLAQVMACCRTAPIHYLHQCELPNSVVLCHSLKSHFTSSAQAAVLYNAYENYPFRISSASLRDQLVKDDSAFDWQNDSYTRVFGS